MRRFHFARHFIRNTFEPFPKLTGFYRRWQIARAVKDAARDDLVLSFSTDIGRAVTERSLGRAKRAYVGFTQDGPWDEAKLAQMGRALRAFDRVTMFTEEERTLYLDRYDLRSEQTVVIPIHTDETNDYRQYPGDSPRAGRYVLSLGSPNRRFTAIARACRELTIPLVIITRSKHANDSLDELRELGAEVITNADKMMALTYLKHATLAVSDFDTTTLPGGFTTLVHAMFLRTPFIVSDCLGMREHVIDGETGFVTPHDEPEALHGAIDRLWNEPGLAEQFGAAAFARGQARHSLEAAAEAFHTLICQMLGIDPAVNVD